jgi:hypothetical protein
MNWQASKFCKVEKYASGDHYVIKPGEYIPATVKRVLEVLAGNEAPKELIPADAAPGNPWFYPGVEQVLKNAQAIPPEAWQLALQAPDGLTNQQRKQREKALAFVERYFKRALTAEVGGKIKLHIVKNETYRR